MNKIDQLAGEKIISISILKWNDNPEGAFIIEKILLSLGIYKIIIGVDSKFDALTVEVGEELQLKSQALENEIVDIRDTDSELNHLLNKKLIWFWKLRNQKGYEDGIQVEVSDHTDRLIVQFMSEASSIRILKLSEIK